MPQLAFLPWLVALILCILALLFVLYPIYRPYRRIPTEPPGSLDVLGTPGEHDSPLPHAGPSPRLEDEQAARSALKEIELDYQLGNLAEPDYRVLRERYMRRAFTAHKLKQTHEQQLDELIEHRLRQMRRAQETQSPELHNETMGNDDEA